MSGRDAVLGAIRRNLPVRDAPLPALPLFDRIPDTERVAEFERRLQQMGGRLMQPGPPDDPLAPARARMAEAGNVCSATDELPGDRILDAEASPARLHDVDLAIVRAGFGVAETGSVAFTERDLGVNALGYLAQHLLVLLDPADIVGNLHHAYTRPDFGSGHYLVLQIGPSATADIEGVLIHGAQGVRSLTVLLLARQPTRQRR